MLTAKLITGEIVNAFDEISSKREYFCPECGQKTRLKAGAMKINHFAHLPNSTCPNKTKESIAHLEGKRLLYDLLRHSKWEDVSLETPFPEIGRRADVSAKSTDDQGTVTCVFEIQNSGMSVEEVDQRTADYNSIGVHVVWIPVFQSFDIEDDCWYTDSQKAFSDELKLTDWQVMMLDYHGHHIMAVVKREGKWSLTFMRMFRCRRSSKEWWSEDHGEGHTPAYSLSNTYHGYIHHMFDDDNLIVEQVKRTGRARSNFKKRWNLIDIFGETMIRPIIQTYYGEVSFPTFPNQ